MKEILERTSCRNFKDVPLEEEQIEKLLRAGMQAPSMGNQQPWEFITVSSPGKKIDLAKIDQYALYIRNTPQIIVLMSNEENLRFPHTWQQDMAACAENMLIEARHLGLGGYWYGIAGDEKKEAFVKELFELPENLKPFAILGFGKMNRYQKPEDRYEVKKIHVEKIGNHPEEKDD